MSKVQSKVVLPLCVRGTNGAIEANAQIAERGLRVLAVAMTRGGEEKDLARRAFRGSPADATIDGRACIRERRRKDLSPRRATGTGKARGAAQA
jgi:hypothetical protein